MIAGYLIHSKGWRWFNILIAILLGFNIITACLFLPETTFKRVIDVGETAAEADKEALENSQHIEKTVLEQVETNAQPDGIDRPHYAGSYWKDLVQFRGRSQEPSTFKSWLRQFSLPFRFLLVPSVVFASVSYGLLLSGYVYNSRSQAHAHML